MSDKRPYNNQVDHYCQKCKRWTLHTRGRKYYSCLTCCTKEDRGLTQVAADGATLCSCEHPRFAVSNPAKCIVCGKTRHR